METILILNPLFSCLESNNGNLKGYRDLVIDPDIESFLKAMQYIKENDVSEIFLLIDSPLHIQQYPELFRNKSDTKKKLGIQNLRHLGQFNRQIIDYYEQYLPNHISLENINVITTSRCYNELGKLDKEEIEKLPKCNLTKKPRTFSCSAMASIGCSIALSNMSSSLVIFTNTENKRTGLDVVIEGAEHAKERLKKEITIKI